MDENMKNGFSDPELHIQFFISDQYKQRLMGFTLYGPHYVTNISEKAQVQKRQGANMSNKSNHP